MLELPGTKRSFRDMVFNRLAVPALALFLGVTGLSTAKASGVPQGAPQPGYGQERDWDAPPQELQEMERRGFHDGIEGARRDFDNHRRPDVNNRDEYRHPQLPRRQREAYREGFRRGYERGVSHLMGEPGRQMREPERQMQAPEGQMREPERGDHDMGPGQGSEVQRRGFQDGMTGARRDFDNHRQPDPSNRDEYRNPQVPREQRDEYREGFRRGYERGMSELQGGHR
jgi:ribosome modulation factor